MAEKSGLRIDHIDVSRQAEAFAGRIASGEVKTYFLQGKWGSGKSEYLREVKDCAARRKFTFIELSLWRPTDKSSLARKIFSQTNPKWSFVFTGIGWFFILSSAVGSIVLALRSKFPWWGVNGWVLPLTSIAVILTTLYGFLQSRWLDIDKILVWISSKVLTRAGKPKVLIVDDFDRLDAETQKELYMFFNLIHGRTRIIFVGDLRKMKNTEDNYLGKIIDQKVALPFQLESRNISQKITGAIKTRLEIQFDSSVIETLFAQDCLTARDANQYLSYVESEFIVQEKKGRVQTDQELFIIYLYLFHPDGYRKLVEGWMPPEKDDRTSALKKEKQDDNAGNSLIAAYMDDVLQHNKNNPPDFSTNTSMYFVNEFATNHSLVELNEATNSEDERRKFFLINDSSDSADSAEYEEILNYIENMTDTEYRNVQEKLELEAVAAMHSEIRHTPNRLVKFVFTKRLKLLVEQPLLRSMDINTEEFNKKLLDSFEGIFNSETIDITERMYCYRTCMNLYGTFFPIGDSFGRAIPEINEKNVSSYFSAEAAEREGAHDFGQRDYDAEVLIAQLGYRYWLDGPVNPTQNPSFESKVNVIEKLKNSEYRAFWNAYGIKPSESEPEKLQGSKALSFNYNDQPYDKHVLAKLKNQHYDAAQ